MAALPKPYELPPGQARMHADILDALADELEAHRPKASRTRVGIDYRNLVASRARRTVIAAIRFRAAAFRRRYDRYVSGLSIPD